MRVNNLINCRGGRRWTCVGFYFVGGMFALAVGVMKYTGNITIVALRRRMNVSHFYGGNRNCS